MNDVANGLLVAIGIGMLIFVHELGHFLAARWVGARVEVFSLGFGPRIWGFRRGPTDYRLSLIPLGGYVAVAGQDPADNRYSADQSLSSKTVGQRALFFAGGVVMNMIFALVAFPIAFGAGVSFPAPKIGHVENGGGAWEARLLPGDRVLRIDGKEVYSFDNLQVEVALAGGRDVQLEILREGQPLSFGVRPQYRSDFGIYTIGIESSIAEAAPVVLVDGNGPAAKAGMRSGDELVAIDGVAASGQESLATLAATPPNGVVQLVRYRRDGQEHEVSVAPVPAKKPSPPQLGVVPFERRVGGLRSGLPLIAALGLQRGDIVLAIDGTPYRGPDLGVVQNGGAELKVLVRRGEQQVLLHAPATARDRVAFRDHVALVVDMASTVVKPAEDGAAIAAGIVPGDRVISIDGRDVHDWSELRGAVQEVGARAVEIVVERNAGDGSRAERQVANAVPRVTQLFDYGFSWQIEQLRTEVQAAGFTDALRLGSICALDLVKQIYVTLKRLVTGDVAAKNLGGIIQITRQSYHNTQWGLPRFLYFLALLSINLAVINLLPIPILDGGHLLFLLIERIKGSPVSVQVLNYSQVLGLVLVLALVLFVTYNDILRLL